jgi:hypothetical protein
MIIINPVAKTKQARKETVKLTTLKGKTVGLFDNGWSSWQVILTEMEEILKQEHGAKDVVRRTIPLSSEAPEELIENAVKVCDLCVVGLGN